jgi:Pectic acid lyase
MIWFRVLLVGALLVSSIAFAAANPNAEPIDVKHAMERAAAFFRNKLNNSGSYVWSYSEDLIRRRGEGGLVGKNVGWNQPPGSPAIGAAYLRMFEATGDDTWLLAAKATAHSLISVQLQSGGWYYSAEIDAAGRKNWCYVSTKDVPCDAIKTNKFKNRTVLDDDTTQSVMRFLIWYDLSTNKTDRRVRRAIDLALEEIIARQFPNGSFPVFSEWAEDAIGADADLAASFPKSESLDAWVKPDDPPYYVANDDIVLQTIRVLLYADQAYACRQCIETAVRAGGFLLAAQLPGPQRGWAQTYDKRMQPVWGRAFEPPAVSSRETAGAIRALLLLHGRTQDANYLDAARQAATWLKSVQLPDGRWARFYELRTSKPLYINSENKVTYSDTDLLDHYTLKSTFGIPAVLGAVEQSSSNAGFASVDWWSDTAELPEQALREKIGSLLQTQDAEGRWVEDGYIHSAIFVDAIFAMARYLDIAQAK